MQYEISPEEKSKDDYFQRLAQLADEMVERHGKDFCIGALVLAVRWVTENRAGHRKRA